MLESCEFVKQKLFTPVVVPGDKNTETEYKRLAF